MLHFKIKNAKKNLKKVVSNSIYLNFSKKGAINA